ncbi:hypothetical protein BLA24064_01188 [Burkholderia latens]|uniref:Uncharacterized protein n=1 Tax=Burkholderia latens TaxID=488446 RepID=A0A6P2IFK7_9BURK|nr:hypothetical protein BLA24064_01188 [Burkholderia latens]
MEDALVTRVMRVMRVMRHPTVNEEATQWQS